MILRSGPRLRFAIGRRPQQFPVTVATRPVNTPEAEARAESIRIGFGSTAGHDRDRWIELPARYRIL